MRTTLPNLGLKLPTFETISVIGNRAKPTLLQSNGANKYVFNIIPRNVLNERIYGFATRVMSPIFHDDNVTMVPIINGAIRFYSELSQYIHEGSTVELMAVQAASYGIQKTPEATAIIESMVIPEKIRGRTVVILDDILDTGSTLTAVSRMIEAHDPRRIIKVFLIRKNCAQKYAVEADYALFEVHRESWVYGFGMDLAEKHRHISFVCDDNASLYDPHGNPLY